MKKLDGFTFIEVMIGIIIVSIAAYGLMIGTVHARGEMRVIAIQDRAQEELLSFMNEMKGKIAARRLTLTEKAGDQQGRLVHLIGNAQESFNLPAKIFYDPIVRVPSANPQNIRRYHLKAWIEWEDHSLSAKKTIRHLDAETVMMEFPL